MTDWDDYKAGLATLSGLNDQLKVRLDDADVAFRRSADDLARGRDDADAAWQKIGERARSAKAIARNASARAGVAVDSHVVADPVDRETVDRRLEQVEKTAAWCEQAANWLARHRDRVHKATTQSATQPVAAPPPPPSKPHIAPPPPPSKRWVLPVIIGLVVVIIVLVVVVILL